MIRGDRSDRLRRPTSFRTQSVERRYRGRRNGASLLNPPAHRAEGRAGLDSESSLQGFSPPLNPPPEASAIPPPGYAIWLFRASRRVPDGVQDELEFETASETLSGRILAQCWPPRGPLLASKIDFRGPQERLLGPTTRTNWNLQKNIVKHIRF